MCKEENEGMIDQVLFMVHLWVYYGIIRKIRCPEKWYKKREVKENGQNNRN